MEEEKVFGQTIRVVPQTEDALASFFSSHQNSTVSIQEHKPLIVEVFGLSCCSSLRVLRQSLLNVDRFLRLLTPEQRSNTRALETLLRLFLALSIEEQRGELGRTEIGDRVELFVRAQHENSKVDKGKQPNSLSPLEKSVARYKSVLEILSYDLSDELLVQMLVDGFYDRVALQSYLTSTELFKPPDQQPAWLRFMQFDANEDGLVNKAAIEMDEQFENRKVDSLGDFMHIVMLRIMRVENGILSDTVSNILIEAKKYLNDLVEQNRFEPEYNEELFGNHPSHAGYLLWGYNSNSENINVISEIGKQTQICRRRVFEKHAPEYKEQILNSMANDIDRFASLFDSFNGKNSKFSRIPALLSISPIEFAEAFVASPVANWRAIQTLLHRRRESISPHSILAGELEWFRKLEGQLIKLADDTKGTIKSLRIMRHLPKR